MSTVAIEYEFPRVMSVAMTEDSIAASLSDGRSISVAGMLPGAPAPRPNNSPRLDRTYP